MLRRWCIYAGVCLTLLCVGVYAHAQVIQQYIEDKTQAVAHLTVSIHNETAPSEGWWKRIWSYLGIRSAVRLKPEVGTTLRVISSAYASSPYQTDATPCITASGTTVRPGVVATNFLPLGTIVSVGGKKYIVEDRMNRRYDGYYMDIWFPSTSEALEFGRKKLDITIVGYEKPGADISDPTPSPEPIAEEQSIWRSIGDSIGNFLGARTYDVNRYDVDCTQ